MGDLNDLENKLCRLLRSHSGNLTDPTVKPAKKTLTADQLTIQVELLRDRLQRRPLKISQVAELHHSYCDQYQEFDYFLTLPDIPNPWISDCTEFWDADKQQKDIPMRRVKRWAYSLHELLSDPTGREQFTKFLEKEYSGENLKFWESVQEMKCLPFNQVAEAASGIWNEYLAPDAPCPVNVDSKSMENAKEALNSSSGPNRWCFDIAAAHVYHLMKSDSYSRYLRSDMYKEYCSGSKKKSSIRPIPNLFGGVKRQLTS